MKFQELREEDPLQVIEVSDHEIVPAFPGHLNGSIIELKKIEMKLFTDGDVEKVSEHKIEKIDEYYIGKRKYPYSVDTLKTKNIFFKNHSYVITYLIAQERATVGKVHGLFDIVQDVNIYLANAKDKNALKSAKRVINDIANNNRSGDYSSVLAMLLHRPRGLSEFEPNKNNENVYTLKKAK